MKTWDEAVERFDEILDADGPVQVADLNFDRSRVFKTLDPIGYRTYLFNYIDGEGIDSDDLEGDIP